MTTTRAKFRNARDTISCGGGGGHENSRKQLPTFPWIQRGPTTTLAATLFNSTGGESMDAGGDGVLFPTVPSSSTNRNVVLRKWRSLDRSLKFYRKKERKEKRIEEEKRSGGCGWINLREKNFGKRFWKNETGENSDSQSYEDITIFHISLNWKKISRINSELFSFGIFYPQVCSY